MKRLLLSLSLALLATATAQRQIYSLELLLNGAPLAWDSGEGVTRNGAQFFVEDSSVPLEVFFEGGRLELHLADFGTFAQPHVTGMRFSRDADPSTLSLGATVRHDDQGWDDYADTIVFGGAENGRLALEHPHDDEQPFTRSKDNVRVTGEVRVSALDNVRSGDGSAIIVDFASAPFAELERGTLRYELVVQPPS